jgi:hypothetical protein
MSDLVLLQQINIMATAPSSKSFMNRYQACSVDSVGFNG